MNKAWKTNGFDLTLSVNEADGKFKSSISGNHVTVWSTDYDGKEVMKEDTTAAVRRISAELGGNAEDSDEVCKEISEF